MIGKDICKKIREIRKSMGLSQGQFAELVNLSVDSIGKIERCATIPTVETLDKIAAGLKIPLKDLISPAKEKLSQKPFKTLEDLIAYLKTRSPEDVRFIHELAIKIFERKK
ncbi:MAG: helix-turn-helix transcriptional regulator [Nitrospiraceae bacterium]|nr:helix-turn-helix transcriptional regulator [Nitrospiraceae bacterium]